MNNTYQQTFLKTCLGIFAWICIIFLLFIAVNITACTKSIVDQDRIENVKQYQKVKYCLEDKHILVNYGIVYCNTCYNCELINKINVTNKYQFNDKIKPYLITLEEYKQISKNPVYNQAESCYNIIENENKGD